MGAAGDAKGSNMTDERMITQVTAGSDQVRIPQEAEMRALCAYWEGLCQGGLVPRRSEIDPRRIGGLLSNAFIAERIAPGVTRLRIAGLYLNDLMGMDVRGMPLTSFIAPAAREGFAMALVDLFDRPARLEMELHSRSGLGRPEMTGRMILLPLRSDLGDVSRALGCLVTDGGIGRASRRFDVRAVRVLPLGGAGVAAVKPLEVLPAGLPGDLHGHGARRGRDYLRVVK